MDAPATEFGTMSLETQSCPSLTGLPPLVQRLICIALDGRSLARLACTSKTFAQTADESVWREQFVQRFGEDALPATPHTAQVPGWTFVQGWECAGEEVPGEQPAGLGVLELAAAAVKAGAEAFTTAGRLKKRVASGSDWQQRYPHPARGTYVKDVVAQRIGDLPASLVPDGSDWPPHIPGFTYFPGVVRTGEVLPGSQHVPLAAAATAAEAPVAAHQDGYKGFTTDGHLLTLLWPQVAWLPAANSGVGVYVKDAIVQQMHLTPPEQQPLPTAKQLYADMQRMHVRGYRMGAVWLNGDYLTLQHDGRSSSGVVLKLNSVCWLDVNAVFKGVLPGLYKVFWRVALRDAIRYGADKMHLSVQATPVEDTATQPQDASSDAAGSSTSANGGDDSGDLTSWFVADGHAIQETDYTGDAMAELQHDHRGQYFDMQGGVIQVSKLSTVTAKWWAHDGNWKSGISWDYVELRPDASDAPGPSFGGHVTICGELPSERAARLQREAAAQQLQPPAQQQLNQQQAEMLHSARHGGGGGGRRLQQQQQRQQQQQQQEQQQQPNAGQGGAQAGGVRRPTTAEGARRACAQQ